MNIRIIRSEAEYEEAMARLLQLMNQEIQPGSEEENFFELLVLVIQEYERQHANPLELDPVETIKFYMEQRELAKKDLIPFLGSMSRVSEVLRRKRPLSLSMIHKLHEGLEIPLESLVQRKRSSRRFRQKKLESVRVPQSRRKSRRSSCRVKHPRKK